MKDYLNFINSNFPMRKTEREKSNFRDYVLREVNNSRYSGCVDKINKHNNIVIGDIDKAKVIFTAHYDTPATAIIPNFILPKNKILWIISIFTFPTLLALISYFIGYYVSSVITEHLFSRVLLCLVIYIGLFVFLLFLTMRCFKNRNNMNDNTSGVSLIINLIMNCDSNDVAFVLFDNEEKGLKGSKAFSIKYENIIKDKLVINFDCVGVGNNVFFILKENSEKHYLLQKLKENIFINKMYNLHFCSVKDVKSNSDYKNFNCGIGVMSCKKKNNIYYVNNIHTNRDKVADIENITFLSNVMFQFINKI